MQDGVTRRDFLNGTQVALGAALLSPWSEVLGVTEAGASSPSGHYPPALTGMRGSHAGSWETMHALVSGQRWQSGPPTEEYDLVVVGGGLSGLSAAWFYRQRNPGARVLVLDNHDDFGGHAKRNEFQVAGQTRIGYGGTEAIDTPSAYGQPALDLLRAIGIELDAFHQAYDDSLYRQLGLSKGIQFDAATFGEAKLAVGYGKLPWAEFAARTPLNERARADLVRLQTSREDWFPQLDQKAKRSYLQRISYAAFLQDVVGVDPQILELYRKWGISYFCVGIDEIPALSVLNYNGMPGLDHLFDLPEGDPYIFHFPDGNAGVARLLVRALVPGSLPGTNMQDSVTARLDYASLDQPGQSVRIRLNSTVVNVRHTPDQSAVDLVCVSRGSPLTLRARHCILACYNMAIPYLCPELPEAQRAGLAYGVKIPLCYVKVAVPNWRAFAELGLDYVYYTNDFYKQVELDFPISLGDYHFPDSPDGPMILHLCHVPYFRDIKGPEQWRQGRRQLLETSFEVFEERVRAQLDQALAGGGFDAGRDITAITVNRWPHGYAYDPHLSWEPEYASEAHKPWVIGRQPFGRIHIANSDAAASAMTQAAIAEAWRAVGEIDA